MGAAVGTRWAAGFCRVPGTPARANTGGPPAPCRAQGGGGGFRARSIELELELLGHLPPVTVEGAELGQQAQVREQAGCSGNREELELCLVRGKKRQTE